MMARFGPQPEQDFGREDAVRARADAGTRCFGQRLEMPSPDESPKVFAGHSRHALILTVSAA
jgi:hypothetical protein